MSATNARAAQTLRAVNLGEWKPSRYLWEALRAAANDLEHAWMLDPDYTQADCLTVADAGRTAVGQVLGITALAAEDLTIAEVTPKILQCAADLLTEQIRE
jgi:hypothetical protein